MVDLHKAKIVLGEQNLKFLSEQEIALGMQEHEKTRTREIENISQYIIEAYESLIGKDVYEIVYCYKRRTILDELLDELDEKVRSS